MSSFYYHSVGKFSGYFHTFLSAFLGLFISCQFFYTFSSLSQLFNDLSLSYITLFCKLFLLEMFYSKIEAKLVVY